MIGLIPAFFKTNEILFKRSDLDQCLDYALDLKYFHQESLYQKPIFGDKPSGNDYTIVNQYGIDDNGMVGNISIADFEKKITNALSSPRTNFTQLISNEAQSYYYRNDGDTQFNDTESLPLTRTP